MNKLDQMRDQFEKFGFLTIKTTKNNGGNFIYLEVYADEKMLRKGKYLTTLQFNNECSKLQFIGLTKDYDNILYLPI